MSKAKFQLRIIVDDLILKRILRHSLPCQNKTLIVQIKANATKYNTDWEGQT